MGPLIVFVITALAIAIAALLLKTGRGNDWRWLRWSLTPAILAVSFATAVTEPWPDGVGLRQCKETLHPRLQSDPDVVPQVLETCEPYGATGPPVLFGVLAALLLLAPDLSEFGVPGLITLKKRIETVEASSEGALSRAEHAETASAGAARRAEVAESAAMLEKSGGPTPPEERWRRVRELVEEYNEVRRVMPSGRERTSQMTRIVTELSDTIEGLPDFDVPKYLGSENRGERLAAYAALYSQPDSRHLDALINSLYHEDKPFGQYWGLRAIERILNNQPDALTDARRARLRDFRRRIPSGTDRAYELDRILAGLT